MEIGKCSSVQGGSSKVAYCSRQSCCEAFLGGKDLPCRQRGWHRFFQGGSTPDKNLDRMDRGATTDEFFWYVRRILGVEIVRVQLFYGRNSEKIKELESAIRVLSARGFYESNGAPGKVKTFAFREILAREAGKPVVEVKNA